MAKLGFGTKSRDSQVHVHMTTVLGFFQEKEKSFGHEQLKLTQVISSDGISDIVVDGCGEIFGEL